MDSTERMFEEITRPFRATIEALIAQPYEPPAPDPLWQRAAAAVGGTLLALLALAALAGALGLLAFFAHTGWEMAG
ncbi:hypothetical protein ACIPWE_40195 [Streptomyces sp. NPDC090073]|uniref:hypothetical protein n=1 Tax=Streptomyces sp. NPDC090073 TaxID=3365936 RepID=UPI0038066828